MEMEYYVQMDKAFLKWMENNRKNVIHIIDAWCAGVKWGNEHPDPLKEKTGNKRKKDKRK